MTTSADGWPATGARSITAHIRAVTEAVAAQASARTAGGEHVCTETLPLTAAAGRVLAADVTANRDLPGFDNSQMDGFAVCAADTPATLPLAPMIPAGHWPDPLPEGQAAPIMTGAPIPAGADAIIPIEDTDATSFDAAVRAGQITVPEVSAGTFVRPTGSDARTGDLLLAAGTRLTVPGLGTIAALGQTEVAVHVRPRAVIYTGGDEVTAPGTTPLPPGALYDANLTMLAAWLDRNGVAVAASRLISDTVADFAAVLEADVAAHAPDLIITSGGISAGRYEVIRQALEGCAAFGSVTMQPGGPQGLGTHTSGAVIICLPGNPVSTWVSAEMFLRPALAEGYRCTSAHRWQPAALSEDVTPLARREQIRRGTWHTDDTGHVTAAAFSGTSSHLLAGAAQATALIRIPAGDEVVPAGSTVQILPLEEAHGE